MNEEIKAAIIRVLPFVVLLTVFSIRVRQKKFNTAELGLQKPVSLIRSVWCWSAFLLFILASEFTLYHLGLLEADKWNHTLLPSVIRITGAVILAPIAEEILFRGILLNKLMQWKGNMHVAIFVQAVLFVMVHSFTYENTLSSNIGIAQTFIDAAIYGYARFYTQSIYTPMAMHSTGNLIATLERFIL